MRFGSAQKSQSRSLTGLRSYWPGAAALDAFSLSPASSSNRLTSGGADGLYAGFARFAAIWEEGFGKKRATVRANPAHSVGSGSEPRQRNAMNASDPTRQMAPVGKPGPGSDFSQPRPTLPNKLDRTLQSEMHHVAMRGHADGSGKHPREMEWAAPRNIRERLDPDRLIEMSDDVIPEPPEPVFAEHATRPGWHRRGMARHQSIDEAARRLVPGEGSVWIIVYALVSQGAGEREKRRVLTA